MKKIQLLLIFLFSPSLCLAHNKQVSKAFTSFSNGWNYPIFTFDNKEVTIANLVIGLAVFIIGMKIAKHLGRTLKSKLFSLMKFDRNAANLVARVIDYILVGVVIIVTLDIAGVPLTIFTFLGGAFVVSVGLSSQHLVNNFISGLVLVIEGKIKVGDLIECDSQIGRVDKIESRAIELKTQDNFQISIPHSKLMQERYTHWTSNEGKIRMYAYFKIIKKGKSKKDFKDIVLDAVVQSEGVLSQPFPQLLLSGFENNHLCYEVRFWLDLNKSERKMVTSEVNEKILNILDEHNIDLAVPYFASMSVSS
jgi:potassium-dependent mechanosensitive channel